MQNMRDLISSENLTRNRMKHIRIEKFRKFTEDKLSPDNDPKEVWLMVKEHK